MWTCKKDDDGKIVKVDGKTKIVRHRWNLCDDVVEEDDKAWDELMSLEIQEKHRIMSKMEAMKPAVALALIFLFAVIAMKLMSDNWKVMVESTQASAVNSASEADKILQGINRMSGFTQAEPENKEIKPPIKNENE